MNITKPKIGFAGLKENWKQDLQAGFSISLIALPLCLGIAIASGFPPIAGLFAAIVGGLVVSRINGSHVTITGPAAGLIVVNLGAIEVLGQGNNEAGYRYALAAIVVAGIIIFILGLLKAGKFGDFFPTSAVHGMLAAIGVIIMAKQIFVAIGVSAHGHELYEVIAEVPEAFLRANPEVAFIAIVSFIILIIYPKIKIKAIRAIPAPMWVLLVAIPLELLMDWQHEHELLFLSEHFKVGPQLLVHLPEKVIDGIIFPDFGKIATSAFWIAASTIALVTAIESMLSAVAVDSLDPFKRKTNLNKDVSAMGIGASVSAFVGGLPMISEIVRSSANVSNGAKTQWSNFFHAIFLLIFMLGLKPIIELIPLSALAAMLVFTGFRLASPKEFKHAYQTGKSELLVFVSTLIMVLATDLLVGIAFGIVINLVVNIAKGASLNNLFKVKVQAVEENGRVTLKMQGAFVFSNYLGLKKYFNKYASGNIVLDLAQVKLLDHTTIHHIHSFKNDLWQSGKRLIIINDAHLKAVSKHELAERSVKGAFSTEGLNDTKTSNILDNALSLDDYNKWMDFDMFRGKRIINVKNKRVAGSTCTFQLSEIEYEDISGLGAFSDTIVAVYLPSKSSLPVFSLHKEHSLDRVFEKLGMADIDFKGHSEFSKTYNLVGENEQEVRKFFSAVFLDFLESNTEFLIESNGSAFMIYGQNHIDKSNDYTLCLYIDMLKKLM